MAKTPTMKTTPNHIYTLQWGSSVALEETPGGIFHERFDARAPLSPKMPEFVTHTIPSPCVPNTQSSPTQPGEGRVPPPIKTLSLNEKVASIMHDVGPLSELEALRAYSETFSYVRLKETATQLVFGDGVSTQPVAMVIGEAPGADEDIQGKPFVGKSGQLLDRILASISLTRATNTYITNVIPWRPPGNRTPTDEEIQLFTPIIARHIELVNPQFLILAGATAIQAVLSAGGGIARIRGKVQTYQTLFERKSFRVMPIYHPSYLLRSPGQKAKAWKDMLTIKTQLIAL